jgi:hypothetical protein
MTPKEEIKELKRELEFEKAKVELVSEEIGVLKILHNEQINETAELISSRKGFEIMIEGLRKDVDKYKAQKEELGKSLTAIELENTELKAAVIKQAKLLCKDV